MERVRCSSNIFLSVVIPCFNSEKYLNRCLSSLCNNKSNDLEFICVNDGSTDGTQGILDHFEKKDQRFINIQVSHAGVSSARNVGIEHCHGQYLCFVDSDDFLTRHGLDLLRKKLKDNHPDLLIHGAKLKGFKKENWMKKPLNVDTIPGSQFQMDYAFIRPGFIPFIWQHVIKKSIIVENKLRFNESLIIGEDQEFIFQYLFHINSSESIKKKIYVHRIRKNSTMSMKMKNPEEYCQEQMKMLTSVYKIFNNNYYISKISTDWLFNSIYWSCYLCSNQTRLQIYNCLHDMFPDDYLIKKQELLHNLLNDYT